MRPRTRNFQNQFPKEGHFAIADYGRDKAVILSCGQINDSSLATSDLRTWSHCRVIVVCTNSDSCFRAGQSQRWNNDDVATPTTLRDLSKTGIEIPLHYANYLKLLAKAKKTGWTQNEHGYWYHADYSGVGGIREKKLLEVLRKSKE